MTNIQETSPEIWKDIVGYEGSYQVSDLGKVKSLRRTHIQKNGKSRSIKGKMKILQDNIDGYNVIALYRDSRPQVKRVAVLVLESFKGQRPSEEHVAMHLDNDKKNDKLTNLKWGTNSENVIHSVESHSHVTPNFWAQQLGAKHHASKIIIQKTLQGNIINRFHGAGEAHRMTGISRFAIAQNARGKSKSTRSGFIFHYE